MAFQLECSQHTLRMMEGKPGAGRGVPEHDEVAGHSRDGLGGPSLLDVAISRFAPCRVYPCKPPRPHIHEKTQLKGCRRFVGAGLAAIYDHNYARLIKISSHASLDDSMLTRQGPR